MKLKRPLRRDCLVWDCTWRPGRTEQQCTTCRSTRCCSTGGASGRPSASAWAQSLCPRSWAAGAVRLAPEGPVQRTLANPRVIVFALGVFFWGVHGHGLELRRIFSHGSLTHVFPPPKHVDGSCKSNQIKKRNVDIESARARLSTVDSAAGAVLQLHCTCNACVCKSPVHHRCAGFAGALECDQHMHVGHQCPRAHAVGQPSSSRFSRWVCVCVAESVALILLCQKLKLKSGFCHRPGRLSVLESSFELVPS